MIEEQSCHAVLIKNCVLMHVTWSIGGLNAESLHFSDCSSPNWVDGSCTHTAVNPTTMSWWYVDLQQEYCIYTVKITNRADSGAGTYSE